MSPLPTRPATALGRPGRHHQRLETLRRKMILLRHRSADSHSGGDPLPSARTGVCRLRRHAQPCGSRRVCHRGSPGRRPRYPPQRFPPEAVLSGGRKPTRQRPFAAGTCGPGREGRSPARPPVSQGGGGDERSGGARRGSAGRAQRARPHGQPPPRRHRGVKGGRQPEREPQRSGGSQRTLDAPGGRGAHHRRASKPAAKGRSSGGQRSAISHDTAGASMWGMMAVRKGTGARGWRLR